MRLTKVHHHKHPRWNSGVRKCDICGKEEFLTQTTKWDNCRSCQLKIDCKTGKRTGPPSVRKLNYCRISYCEACQGIVRLKRARKVKYCSAKCAASNRKGEPVRGKKWTSDKFSSDKERKRAYDKHHYSKTKNRVKRQIRLRLKSAIKRKLIGSNQSKKRLARTEELLGCTLEFFVQYIESMLQPGMTWENYGFDTWHLDHIIPLSYFNVLDEEQLKLACNYKNMQPLWARENLSKNNKILCNIEEHLSILANALSPKQC